MNFNPSGGFLALVLTPLLVIIMPAVGLVLLIIGNTSKSGILITIARYLFYITAAGALFLAVYFLIYIYSIA